MRLLVVLSFLGIWSCQNQSTSIDFPSSSKLVANNKLDAYWLQGKAKISTFTLSQNRYNTNHENGEVILIQVSEDFLTDKQVKNDNYTNPKSTQVLKSNLISRFTTGIYDYSIMTSTFTPVDSKSHPHTLKITCSSQDWCGQSFHQINNKGNQILFSQKSYFESEGDKTEKLKATFIEDELLNRIRLNPTSLPIGNFEILPSSQVIRLKHLPIKTVQASASQNEYSGQEFNGENIVEYSITFPSLSRDLKVYYEKLAPHKIKGWTDSYPSAFDKKIRTTKATLKTTVLEPYWNQNSPKDIERRTELMLK